MRYDRVYNFSAGPAMMPESVLEEIAAEVLNYHGSGMSVMEMSRRSPCVPGDPVSGRSRSADADAHS